MSQNSINCPNCGESIDVNALVYHQLQEQAKKELDLEFRKREQEFESKKNEYEEIKSKLAEEKNILDIERDRILKEKQDYEEKFKLEIDKKIKEEKLALEKELRNKLKSEINEEKSEEMKLLQEELNQKKDEIKDLNKMKAMLAKLEREKEEMKDRLEAENELALNKKLIEEKEKIRKELDEKIELKLKDKDLIIEDLKKAIDESKRKAEKGSQQSQGEAQEIAIEEFLKNQFPFDEIIEVKKGVQGADCFQNVKNGFGQLCGTIYYESKRTKNFNNEWIEKFKSDMRNASANIGVLVTETMPKEMDRMGLKDGIWVCSFEEFKGLSLVLRQSLIDLSQAMVAQENKGDKMAMLYDFLTSNEFRQQIEAIVEGFTQMQEDLDKEKRSMQGHWKRREKQIEKVLMNTNFMYNSIKGIAGNAIQSVKLLEYDDE